MTSHAYSTFDDIRDNVAQLIALHGRVQQGPGRRHRHEAIHRAGVVMMIGAWEAYVESVLLESFDVLYSQVYATGAPHWARSSLKLDRARAKKAAKRFHTPNAENVQRLFTESLDFDPWPHWTWSAPRRTWTSREMRDRMNKWLRIRHCVAHGSDLPANIQWIQSPQGQPRLTLDLLRESERFFRRVVTQTDASLAQFLSIEHSIPSPW